MSFIDSVFKRFSSVQKGVPTGFFSILAPFAMPHMGEKEYLRAYQGWVYACTNAIADRVADIELTLEHKNGKDWKEVENHPALQLLHEVNNFTTFTQNLYAYEAFQQLHGNSFWYIAYNSNGKPCEIWQLNPSEVYVVKDKKEFIKGYVYRPDGTTEIPLKPEEVIHFKRFNPLDPYRGMGTVQAAALSIDINKYSQEWQRNFFGNSAMPSGALVSEGSLTPEQYDRIRMSWESKYRGVQNAHRMAIFEAGLKFINFTPNSREMQFTESRKDIRDEILAIFRVPKPILGITEDVNLASAQATEYIFSKYVIKPRMGFLVSGLNEFYLPMWGLNPQQYRFNFVDPVPQNIEQQIQIANTGRNGGWLSKNEARAMFNLPPREGADDLDESALQTPIPDSDKPDDPAHAEQDEEEEDNENEGEKSVKKKEVSGKPVERSEASKKKEQDYKAEQIALLHKTYLSLNTRLKKELVARVAAFKSTEPIYTTPQPLTKRTVGKENVGMADELVRFLFDNYDEWIGLVYNATEAGLKRIFDQAGKDTFADLQMEGSFDLQNPRALEWLSQHAMEDSQSYSKTMKDDISLKVQEGVEQGLSNEKIADSLAEFFDGQSDYRAMRIARTETINGYGAGNLEGFKQSGVISGKSWLPDAEACPSCLENADAGVIPLDADFPSGVPCPTAHPNCECSLLGQTDVNA